MEDVVSIVTKKRREYMMGLMVYQTLCKGARLGEKIYSQSDWPHGITNA